MEEEEEDEEEEGAQSVRLADTKNSLDDSLRDWRLRASSTRKMQLTAQCSEVSVMMASAIPQCRRRYSILTYDRWVFAVLISTFQPTASLSELSLP